MAHPLKRLAHRPADFAVAAAAVHAALDRRGWGMADLAAACGLGEPAVTKLVRGIHRDRLGRARIEAALKCPVWSSLAEWDRRQRMAKFLGLDPEIERIPRVRMRATRMGVPRARQHTKRVTLYPHILKHLETLSTSFSHGKVA